MKENGDESYFSSGFNVCSLGCADSVLLPAFELQGFASQVSASTPSVPGIEGEAIVMETSVLQPSANRVTFQLIKLYKQLLSI